MSVRELVLGALAVGLTTAAAACQGGEAAPGPVTTGATGTTGTTAAAPRVSSLTADQIRRAVESADRVPAEVLLRASDCSAETADAALSRLRADLGESRVAAAETSALDPCLVRVTLRAQDAAAEQELVAAALTSIASDPALQNTVAVSTNGISRIQGAPNDPQFGVQWGLSNAGQNGGVAGQDLNVAPVWDAGNHGSASVIVAVPDTGVDLSHPDLAPNLWPGCVSNPAQCDLTGGGSPTDNPNFPNGTLVSGLIGARGNNGVGAAGVNWEVSLMPLKVCDNNGYCTNQKIIEAISFARSHGARVVNMSFGSSTYSQTLASAIAAAPDVLFVAGAGNDGNATPFYPAALGYPNVISVAAIDSSGQLGRFTAGTSTNYGSWVDVAAPGVLVLTTLMGGSYDYVSGTSFAAPMVSGAAALVLARNPALSASQVKSLLVGTSQRLLPQTLDPQKFISGGRVDVGAALATNSPPAYVAERWGTSGDVAVPGEYFQAGRTDVAVFRPGDGNWYIKRVGGAETRYVSWGLSDDVPCAGDFLGVGRAQIAQFRPSTGDWYVFDAGGATSQVTSLHWGAAGDVPVPGNYLGSSAADYAVYRPSTGAVWIYDAASGRHTALALGTDGDVPVRGQFFGNGRDQVAVFHPDGGVWTLADAETGETRSLQWGARGDVPFSIRYYDADRADLAVFRPAEGVVYIRSAADERWTAVTWGTSGDQPFAGDFLGNGRQQIVQWRASAGVWWITDLPAR